MSVYVGAAEWEFGRMMMCHCMADSTEELFAMMDRIGVQRRWIQKAGTPHEHFDICRSKRALAVGLGAIEVDHRGEVAVWDSKIPPALDSAYPGVRLAAGELLQEIRRRGKTKV